MVSVGPRDHGRQTTCIPLSVLFFCTHSRRDYAIHFYNSNYTYLYIVINIHDDARSVHVRRHNVAVQHSFGILGIPATPFAKRATNIRWIYSKKINM